MRYETFINDEWVEQKPTVTGQKYRLYDDAGGMLQSFWVEPETDNRAAYEVSGESVLINGEPATKFAGSYYCNSGDNVTLSGQLVGGDVTIPVTVKMPVVRHANGQPTQDEIYFNVTVQGGDMTASGVIPWSGDWKILTARVNEALHRIGADWKLQHEDVTFLA